MVNTFYDSYRILMHVYSEKAYLKQAINSEPIEPINKSAVIKICYGVIENDIQLEYVISKFCEKRPKLPIRVLLKIALYNLRFLNKAPYAVTDSVVELCKKLGKGANAGFLNATLRKYVKNPNVNFPTNLIDKLSIEYSYPTYAVKMLIKDYGEERAKSIMQNSLAYTFLRFSSGVNGEDYLKSVGAKYDKTVFDNCFMLKNFVRDDGFYQGLYTFQSIGSVAICDVIEGGNNLLDCCSAPGGKAVLLSNKFNQVVACELHEHRANLINEYVSRMKVTNVSVRVQDATNFLAEFNMNFDAVLCDSPCSGFGVTKDNPDIKLNREEQNVRDLCEIQFKILSNVSNYVKAGGSLYYSTCSIFNCENDGIIKRFLSANKNFEIANISSPLEHEKTKFGLQFLPDTAYGAGFYVCKMQRK